MTPSGLLDARKEGADPIELPVVFTEFEQLLPALQKLPSISAKLRKHAAVHVAARLLRLKRQTGTFGFADMLSRLRTALTSDNGERLRQRILAQYPVSLIDEFQDTSPVQYQIFDQIYDIEANDRQSAIFLIGDPKQSIYGFRGADIYSYMQARQATTRRHYVLQTNFRSTDALVGVVNHWFGQAESKPSEGAFMYREGAANPLPFSAVLANGRAEDLVTSQGLMPAMTLVHDLEMRNSRDSTRVFAARCAEQIVTWLNDPNAGLNELDNAGNSTRTPLRPADIAILVRTGKEADAVRRQLALRSIASVYLSDKDSVFASEVAQDLVHWLRAVAAPQDARLVRAGLATRTIGLSLEELGSLASSDDVLDKYIAQLRQFQTVWQTQGVLAMLRQSLHQLGLPSLWLENLDGERRLTNFLHIAELLQTAAATLDGEQALIRWLQTEISSDDSQADDQIVRLESDADLIKVVTIHKSKGLEYSVVCLPFATSFREIERKNASFVSLADHAGVRTLSLNISDAELGLADRERLREDLRLLYVALTRARHSLWVGFPALKVGNGKKCVSHKSGAGHLLGSGALTTAEEWQDRLIEFAKGNANIRLKNAEEVTSCTALVQTASGQALTERPNYHAEFERNWKIGSFSLLSRDLAASAPASASELSIIQKPSPADDEPDIEESAEMATPAASLKASALTSAHAWHLFPKGAESGNFLHDQLEWLTAERFALQGNEPLAQRLQRRCERAGREKYAQSVVNWLCEVVQTRLPGPNAALSELHHVLPEMEFWLPADRMEANEIDRQCRAHLLIGVERPALAERQLHGMLMGFADLVFEFEGKYWVLDYKSNHLGEDDAAYSRDKLAQSMAQHRYDVQAAIYMLALHRLLRLRLGTAYDPKTHLGGAVYLFLRGIKGPERGVCLIPASPPLMDALDAMLDDGEGDAWTL
jgi:exodeoxyribonuclease V beta subunit